VFASHERGAQDKWSFHKKFLILFTIKIFNARMPSNTFLWRDTNKGVKFVVKITLSFLFSGQIIPFCILMCSCAYKLSVSWCVSETKGMRPQNPQDDSFSGMKDMEGRLETNKTKAKIVVLADE